MITKSTFSPSLEPRPSFSSAYIARVPAKKKGLALLPLAVICSIKPFYTLKCNPTESVTADFTSRNSRQQSMVWPDSCLVPPLHDPWIERAIHGSSRKALIHALSRANHGLSRSTVCAQHMRLSEMHLLISMQVY